MRLDPRYIVLKIKDIESSPLTIAERKTLSYLCDRIMLSRYMAGRGILQCVVVESDWPEYDPVIAMLRMRVEGSFTTAKKPHLWRRILMARDHYRVLRLHASRWEAIQLAVQFARL